MEFPANLKALIFDLDGTLFNLNIDWEGLAGKLKEEIPSIPATFAEIPKVLKGSELDKAMSIIDKAEMDGVVTGTPIPNASNILKQLASKYKIGVFTRNGRAATEDVIDKIGLQDAFIVTRDDVENQKPNQEGIEVIMNKLGIEHGEVIMIGDSIHDIQAAHNAQIPCIILNNPVLEYVPKGDYNIRSLDELIGLL